MKERKQHFFSTVLDELEQYFKDKKEAKKSGHIALNVFVLENRAKHKELSDTLKADVKDMIAELNLLNIDLNDIYNYKNKSLSMYKKMLANENENQEQKSLINEKTKELKQWYVEHTKKIDADIDELEKLIIRSKHVIAKVEERRFLDLRPTHLIVAVGVTMVLTLLAGSLINFLYLIPMKGLHPNNFAIVIIIVFSVINFLFWLQLILRHSFGRLYLNDDKDMWKGAAAGFVSAFVDTLGIGSFATATAMFKITKAVRPHEYKKLPGTLNVGLAVSQMFAGILFLGAIEVDPLTLVLFCLATVIGTFVGAIFVEKLHRIVITFVISISLLATAVLMILVLTDKVFVHGTKTGLSNKEDIWLLILGMFLFLLLGVLMSFGVGLYAPSMVVISILGLDPMTSIPIMTCAAAFAQQTAAWRYSSTNNYLPKISLNMAVSSLVAVFSAFVIVFVLIIGDDHHIEEIIVTIMRSLNVVVVVLTAAALLRNYIAMKKDAMSTTIDENELMTSTPLSEKYDNFITSIKASV